MTPRPRRGPAVDAGGKGASYLSMPPYMSSSGGGSFSDFNLASLDGLTPATAFLFGFAALMPCVAVWAAVRYALREHRGGTAETRLRHAPP